MDEQNVERPIADPADTGDAIGTPMDVTVEEMLAAIRLTPGGRATHTVSAVGGWLMAVLAVGFLLMTVIFYATDGVLYWQFLLLAALWLVLAIAGLAVFPRRQRRRQVRAFEDRIAAGSSYYGFVRVFPDRIEKQGDLMTAVVPFDGNTYFVEHAEVMVCQRRGTPLLVLPARCMTPELAAAIRAAADRLPSRNRRFCSRLQPQGQPVVPPPATENETLWEQPLRYNREEYAAVGRTLIRHSFEARAPLTFGLALLLGLSYAAAEESVKAGVSVFLLLAAVTVLTGWVIPTFRLRRLPADVWVGTGTLRLTARGVALFGEAGCFVTPWTRIRHVINRDAFVEIQSPDVVVLIPKRQIEDFEAFDRMITDVWATNSNK